VHLDVASPAATGRMGATMTVIYSAQNEAPRKSRTALLPLLVILFIFSYTILALLVVEQGRTIETQRGLLREMLRDSTQLAALRSQLARSDAQQASSKPAAQTQRKDDKGEVRGNRDSAEGTTKTAPPKTSGSSETKHPGKSARAMKEIPEKPAADLQDARRSTSVI
jgi:hypothetical protein